MTNKEAFRHEALDRAHVLMDNIDTHLRWHPYIGQNKEYFELVESAFYSLHKVYQLIGAEK